MRKKSTPAASAGVREPARGNRPCQCPEDCGEYGELKAMALCSFRTMRLATLPAGVQTACLREIRETGVSVVFSGKRLPDFRQGAGQKRPGRIGGRGKSTAKLERDLHLPEVFQPPATEGTL